MEKRIEYLDIAKGIGIILVVVGHCLNSISFPGRWIWSFHMPFFFFVSGVFFKEIVFTEYLKRKVDQLIIPFLFFGLLILLLRTTFYNLNNWFEVFFGNIKGFLVLGKLDALWFLPILFFSSILFYVINLIKIPSLRYLCLAICIITSYILYNPDSDIPYSITTVFSATFFYGLGYTIKNLMVNINNNKVSNNFLVLSITFFLSILVAYYINPAIDMSSNRLHPILPTYLGAINGILMLIMLSGVIQYQPIKHLNIFLVFLGKNTLTIMAVHMFFIGLSSQFMKPFFSTYFLYKLAEQSAVWICSILSVLLINRYFPFVVGKKKG